MRESALPAIEPIAIIGIGCRFPGAEGPAALWQLVMNGVDAITDMPAGRFDTEAFYDPAPGARGKIVTRQGGFLDQIDGFEPSFFGISPREAACIDPQQRLLLEVAWEAVEDAGVTQERLAGSDTGVFIGMWTSEYEGRMFGASSDVDLYVTTGGGRYAASGRLSYALDLRGPSMTLDTACSSSLVAVHLACQSLRSGESEMALAGGVNLILEPHITIGYSRSAMLSADGRCRFGDARAAGYVRSEGVGLVLLKPLSRALADRDRIHAVIRGSAVNNDGQGSGLLVAPSPIVQAAMLRQAYRVAGVEPKRVGYVEAHGTGTRVGDPVELAALGEVLGEGRLADHPCLTGSIKTNIGHTEAASGIAGLIKAVLCLQHRLVPPSLHFSEPNPRIPWDELPLVIARTAHKWADDLRPAYAGVNSFGVTGTNAHVVLEEAPATAARAAAARSGAQLLTLTAKTPMALRALADRCAGAIDSDVDLGDLCYTAGARRTHHGERLAVVGATRGELAAGLRAYASETASPSLAAERARASRPRVVFVFPGQGSQWLGMGRALLASEPAFAAALRCCQDALAPHVHWSLLDELAADPAHSQLERIDVVQPTLFAIQVALAALWRAWGVEPDAVVGHSMGEIAAAHVAGALGLDDAARIIATRSRLLRRIAGRGAMAMVELSLDDARDAIAGQQAHLSVAVANSPRSTVISGDVAAIDELLARLHTRGVFGRRVKVDVASHSPQVDELRTDLLTELRGLAPRGAGTRLYSTVTGTPEDGAGLGPDYWVRNLREPVLFARALERLAADGFDAFVEISPHPVLLPAVQDAVRHAGVEGAAVLPSTRREEDERAVLLVSLGSLWARGYPVAWASLFDAERRVVSLPAYPWQREPFWYEGGRSRAASTSQTDSIEDLFSVVEWQAGSRFGPAATCGPGRWLIVANAGGPATALVASLQAAGDQCVRLSPADVVAGTLAETLASPGLPIVGCVHLASVEVDPDLSPTTGPAADLGWASALSLVQALARRTVQPPRLWLVTRGAQRATASDPSVSLGAAALWGVGAVVAYEHPALRTTRIDLGLTIAEADMAALADLLRRPEAEDAIALRGATRYVPRLVRRAPTVSAPMIHADGAYLVVGGLGGLGLTAVRWLAASGARYVTVMGRRALSPEAAAALDALRAAGVEVSVARGDVTEGENVRRVVAGAACARTLRGVIHAAGSLDDGLLLDLDPRRFAAVMAAKVDGARHLDEATETAPLDFFVAFSSMIGVLGSPGQANYAAANAGLDAVIARRQAAGRPALSIAWGPWTRVGLAAARDDRGHRLQGRGLGGLTPEEGTAALGRVLGASGTVVIARFDARRWSQAYPTGARSLLGAPEAPPAAATASSGVLERLRAANSAERGPLLESELRQQIGLVLRLAPEQIEREAPLKVVGLNSLMSLELRNRLELALGLTLPATLVWNYPTVAAIAVHLLERLGLATDAAAPAAPAEDAELEGLLAEIQELPDDEVRRLLAEGGSSAR
jgi:acyl transferase domain-containing protein